MAGEWSNAGFLRVVRNFVLFYQAEAGGFSWSDCQYRGLLAMYAAMRSYSRSVHIMCAVFAPPSDFCERGRSNCVAIQVCQVCAVRC